MTNCIDAQKYTSYIPSSPHGCVVASQSPCVLRRCVVASPVDASLSLGDDALPVGESALPLRVCSWFCKIPKSQCYGLGIGLNLKVCLHCPYFCRSSNLMATCLSPSRCKLPVAHLVAPQRLRSSQPSHLNVLCLQGKTR